MQTAQVGLASIQVFSVKYQAKPRSRVLRLQIRGRRAGPRVEFLGVSEIDWGRELVVNDREVVGWAEYWLRFYGEGAEA